uniref:KAT8 regulatory NSL complex subunit 3 n=1 Tax=Strigamia maritima TaxID=126957 RepID=T1IM69_STRMM
MAVATAMETSLGTVSVVSKILPTTTNYKILDLKKWNETGFTSTLRTNISTKEDAVEWVKLFEKTSLTTYRVDRTYRENSQRLAFKKLYHCHQNTKPRSHGVKNPHPKHVNCNSKLTVTIKQKHMRRSKDPYLKEYPCEIYLRYNHNHPIETPEALKFRRPTEGVRKIFLTLFENGYTPIAALKKHKLNLMKKFGEGGCDNILADRAHCPNAKWCYDLYRNVFKKEKLAETNRDKVPIKFEKLFNLGDEMAIQENIVVNESLNNPQVQDATPTDPPSQSVSDVANELAFCFDTLKQKVEANPNIYFEPLQSFISKFHRASASDDNCISFLNNFGNATNPLPNTSETLENVNPAEEGIEAEEMLYDVSEHGYSKKTDNEVGNANEAILILSDGSGIQLPLWQFVSQDSEVESTDVIGFKMASTPSSCAMSPISEVGSDDGRYKQGSYYAQIIGISPKEPIKEREIDVISQDHAYSKPWSAHPDASHARPTRTLFMTRQIKPQRPNQTKEDDEFIDVDSFTVRSVSAYDEAKARVVKDECERHVSCVRLDPGNLDWEENIANIKASWSVSQNLLFNKILKILHSDRLARLAYVNHPNEPVLRRVCVDRTAKRFRQIMASINWDLKLSQWLHTTLVDQISHPYLAAYMDILQTLKAKIPSLIDKMVAPSLVANRVGAKTAEAVALVLKRPWDPVTPQFVSHKAKKLPGSPFLLLVPSGPAHPVAGTPKRSRFWSTQLAAMGKVVPVTMNAVNTGSTLTINQCLEHLIGAIRTKVSELQTNFPNRSIVLIGWNVGALAACHVALVENVSLVVCLGFPFVGMNGKRGDVDDPLLECRVPILFFIGQNANLCRQDDLEEMREHMRCETSLVVIGGADDNLRLSHAKKKLEGVTTSMVDRCLLDEISNFLGPVLTRHQSHNVDTSYTSTGSTNSSDSSSVKDGRKRKKKVLPGLSQDLRTYTFSPAVRRKAAAQVKNNKASTGLKNPKVLMHSSTVGTAPGKRQLSLAAKRRRIQASPVSTPSPNKRRPMWSTATADSLSSDSSNQSQPGLSTPTGLDLGQDEPDIINIDLSDSPKRVQRGISLNIGSLSSLTQFNRNYAGRTISAAGSSESDGSHMPHVIYKRMVGPVGVSGANYSDIISRGRGSRLKITRGGNISSRNSAFFAIPRSSATTNASGMSSLLSGAGRSNFIFATVPPRESLLSNQIVEPDQSQVQAIQRLQFHDFPLTTASFTKTGTGNPILTQAKILSNLKGSSATTTTTASTIRQSIIPNIGSTINTTQSLLSSGTSAFVRNTPTRKTYIASSAAVLASKQNLATSLLVGSKVTRIVDGSGRTSLCEILPSMSLHIPNKQLSDKHQEVAVLMLSDTNEKMDDDLPSSDLDINKALGEVDLTGSDDNLLDMIGDIEGTLGENPLESFGSVNESEAGVSELGIPPDQLAVLDLPLRQFDPPKTDDALLESSMEMFSDIDPLLESPNDQSMSVGAETPTGRVQRPVFPTIASTRTRRIRTPKYYNV